MSNLFGSQKGTDQLQSKNIMKDDFGWEIPIEIVPIPSNGVIYPSQSILHNLKTVKIKAMTAREEDILSSQALIKEGTVIEHLINSCVMEKNFDVNELIMGDRNALLVAIRITGYGAEYPVNTRCKFCNAYNEEVIDLTNLPIKRLKISPVSENSNLFEFILPVTKKKVLFKFMNAKEDREKQMKIESMEKNNFGPFVGDVTHTLENVIQSIEGITDKNKIKHFIINMPALDAKKLRNYIRENEPGIDMKFKYKCKNCNNINENISLPISSNFFWPA
jgi:hypothetical protein